MKTLRAAAFYAAALGVGLVFCGVLALEALVGCKEKS